MPSFAEIPRPLPLPSITNINFAPSDPPPYLNPDNDYSSQQPPKKDEPKPVQPIYVPASTPQESYSPPQASTPAYSTPPTQSVSSKKSSDDILGYILIGIGAGALAYGAINADDGVGCRTNGQGDTTCSSEVAPGAVIMMALGVGIGGFGVWFAVD